MYKDVIGIAVELFQIGEVPGISEDIEVDDPDIARPFTDTKLLPMNPAPPVTRIVLFI